MSDIYEQIVYENSEDKYTHDELNDHYIDERSVIQISSDKYYAFLKEIKKSSNKLRENEIIVEREEYCYPDQPEIWKSWKNNSEGLCILTHGLGGKPSTWNCYIDALKKKNQNVDIRAPYVPHKGNCSLEESTSGLRNMLKNYIDEQINKKQNNTIDICLYGVSNGARITLNILNNLIDDNLNNRLLNKNLNLNIIIYAIAGVFRGTQYWKISLPNSFNFIASIVTKNFGISPHILDDFSYKSHCSTCLIDSIRNLQVFSHINIKYHFYTSTEDDVVIPYTSCLPIINKNEKHYILHAENHSSIVTRLLPIIT